MHVSMTSPGAEAGRMRLAEGEIAAQRLKHLQRVRQPMSTRIAGPTPEGIEHFPRREQSQNIVRDRAVAPPVDLRILPPRRATEDGGNPAAQSINVERRAPIHRFGEQHRTSCLTLGLQRARFLSPCLDGFPARLRHAGLEVDQSGAVVGLGRHPAVLPNKQCAAALIGYELAVFPQQGLLLAGAGGKAQWDSCQHGASLSNGNVELIGVREIGLQLRQAGSHFVGPDVADLGQAGDRVTRVPERYGGSPALVDQVPLEVGEVARQLFLVLHRRSPDDAVVDLRVIFVFEILQVQVGGVSLERATRADHVGLDRVGDDLR